MLTEAVHAFRGDEHAFTLAVRMFRVERLPIMKRHMVGPWRQYTGLDHAIEPGGILLPTGWQKGRAMVEFHIVGVAGIARGQTSAEPFAFFKDSDMVSGFCEEATCGESGDSGSDNGDDHKAMLKLKKGYSRLERRFRDQSGPIGHDVGRFGTSALETGHRTGSGQDQRGDLHP